MLGGVAELAAGLRELPGVVVGHVGEQVQGVAQRGHPRGQRLGALQAGEDPVEPLEELGEASGQPDVAAVDVVERQREAEPLQVGLVGGDAQQDPVEPGVPGVLGDPAQAVRGARPGPQSPPDPGPAGPVAQPLEVVVGEAEGAAHRRRRGEVEDLAGGDPAVGKREQPGERVEQGVGLPQGPVRQAHPQPVTGVARAGLAEGGADQRRVGLDVGTHHQHVARLEQRVLGEQVEQRLAQHLDLAGRAVAGVHLDGAVGGSGRGRLGVVAQRRLHSAEQGRRGGRGREVLVLVDLEQLLQLAGVAGQAGEQRVRDGQRARVVGAPPGG